MASIQNELKTLHNGEVDLAHEPNIRRMFKRLFEVGHLIEADRDKAVLELKLKLVDFGWSRKKVEQLANQAGAWSTISREAGRLNKRRRR